MSKKILTLVVLAAGVEAIAKAVSTNKPEDVAAEILEMHNEAEAANTANAKTKADLEDALKLNAMHEKTIQDFSSKKPAAVGAGAKKADVPTFELDGKKYGFELLSVSFKGTRITAEQVCADVELQKQLINRQSGMIKEL